MLKNLFHKSSILKLETSKLLLLPSNVLSARHIHTTSLRACAIRTMSPLTSKSKFSVLEERLLVGKTPIRNNRPATHKHYSTFNTTSQQKGAKSSESLYVKIKSISSFIISGFLIIGAVGLSIIVIYLIFSELFSPNGDTHIFNRVVNMIEDDKHARELLHCKDVLVPKSIWNSGYASVKSFIFNSSSTSAKDSDYVVQKEKLKAYGETMKEDRWTRNRPIQSMRKVGKDGKERYFMKFNIESSEKVGRVFVEAVESEKKFKPDFLIIYMDVPGEKRHYLVRPQIQKSVIKPKGLLGLNWGPK